MSLQPLLEHTQQQEDHFIFKQLLLLGNFSITPIYGTENNGLKLANREIPVECYRTFPDSVTHQLIKLTNLHWSG